MGLNITFQLGALPEAFSGSPQEFADLLVARLSAVVSGSFMTGQIGGVEPTNDVGLYVNTDSRRIKVWSDEDGEYKPVTDVPVGVIAMWGASSPPEDWLICDGSILQRDDYPDLFQVIGTNWGNTGATDFKLPKTQGRAPFGVGRADYTDNPGSGRTDKSLHTFIIGKDGYFGYDFVNYPPTPANGPDFSNLIRSQASASTFGLPYVSEVINPAFGVNFIIKAK